MKKNVKKQMVKKPKKKAIEEFVEDTEGLSEVEQDERDGMDEDIPDENKDVDDEEDGETTVIDMRGIDSGKVIQFVHAGGKVTATILKVNPNGTIYATAKGTKYPNIHTTDILKDGETPGEHLSVKKKIAGKVVSMKSDQPRGGIIGQIIKHYESGKSKADIIALGFNKSTVNRQVGEYIKRQKQ